MSLKDRYAIVGVGYTPQGRVPDRTTLSFHLEACANAIDDAGLKPSDIDVYEINEAFASQAIYSCRQIGIEDRYWAGDINPNGGAIAIGHPLGCTGAKLTAQLLHEMQRRKAKRGIVSMCIGGGMGAAGIYEML